MKNNMSKLSLAITQDDNTYPVRFSLLEERAPHLDLRGNIIQKRSGDLTQESL